MLQVWRTHQSCWCPGRSGSKSELQHYQRRNSGAHQRQEDDKIPELQSCSPFTCQRASTGRQPLLTGTIFMMTESRKLENQNWKEEKTTTSTHGSNRSKKVCSPLNTWVFGWSGKLSSNCTALIFHTHPQDLNKRKTKTLIQKVRKINREAVFTEENFIAIKKKAHLENNCLLH